MEPGLNPHWYAAMLEEQRKYNTVVAFATVITALVGILQVNHLYNLGMPDWVLLSLVFFAGFCLMAIISEIFKRT